MLHIIIVIGGQISQKCAYKICDKWKKKYKNNTKWKYRLKKGEV